jgi:hypothetical protein
MNCWTDTSFGRTGKRPDDGAAARLRKYRTEGKRILRRGRVSGRFPAAALAANHPLG